MPCCEPVTEWLPTPELSVKDNPLGQWVRTIAASGDHIDEVAMGPRPLPVGTASTRGRSTSGGDRSCLYTVLYQRGREAVGGAMTDGRVALRRSEPA